MLRRNLNKSGFTLLVTIVLVSFLVLLLVGLASLTRVETQVATNSQQQNTARQNALFALNIALGQVQKHLGPDQRASARADILPDTRSTTDVFDDFVTPRGTKVYNNNSYMTGVWGNEASSSATPYSNTPKNLTWLVSGNESAKYTIVKKTPDYGRISSTGSAAPPIIAANKLNPSADQPIVQLVGPGSVGTGAEAQKQMIGAITQPITVDASQASLLGLSSGTTIGRYAYWVGDEGIKAKYNVADEWAKITSASDPRIRYRNQSAQRLGIDAMSKDGVDKTNLIGKNAYDQLSEAGRAQITKAISLNSIDLSSPIDCLRQKHFHNITTYSQSVLSNIRDGGLKKDLTAGLASGTTEANAPIGPLWQINPTILGASYGTNLLQPGVANYDGRGVNWQLLRNYMQLSEKVSGTGTNASMDPIAPKMDGNMLPTQMGVFPIVVGYQIHFQTELIRISTNGPYQLILRHIPAVVLWNPYNVTLNSATYGFKHNFDHECPVSRRAETQKLFI